MIIKKKNNKRTGIKNAEYPNIFTNVDAVLNPKFPVIKLWFFIEFKLYFASDSHKNSVKINVVPDIISVNIIFFIFSQQKS